MQVEIDPFDVTMWRSWPRVVSRGRPLLGRSLVSPVVLNLSLKHPIVLALVPSCLAISIVRF